MLKVLVIDDHAIVREGIRQIFAATSEYFVSDEATNRQEALEKVKSGNFDVIILDISLPDVNGLSLLQDLKSIKPDIPVLILSIRPEQQYAVRAIKSGASGYLNKSCSPQDLIVAINKVVAGSLYISGNLAQLALRGYMLPSNKSPHDLLSNREYEVLIALAAGTPIHKIAKLLFLSPKTISTFRHRILTKMNMKNNSELLRYAVDNNLID